MITKRFEGKSLASLATATLRVLHPSLTLTLVKDGMGWQYRARESKRHLDATIQWLNRAQDVTGCSGVSVGYSVMKGWWPPYPETTGYIIPSFYDYSEFTGREEYRDRARRMADWEIEVQLPSGAVQAGPYHGDTVKRIPAAFNTGQVILGWCRAYLETKDERYLAAALRAGDWLVNVQSDDGTWRLRGLDTETSIHAYDVRNAWSLLELNELANDRRYVDAAKANCEWTLAQQEENGWFRHNSFFVSSGKWSPHPFTHTIAYVMEGLLESWRLLGDDRYLMAVVKTADTLLQIFETRDFMPGEFDSSWNTTASYGCLTGNAQIAGVWLRLYQISDERRYLDGAVKLNNHVKVTQNLYAAHPGVRGGVKGSFPIFGGYTPFAYINWGAKFLVDSLLLEEQILGKLARESAGQANGSLVNQAGTVGANG